MTALLMRFNEKSRKVREYTAGEEVVNSLTHAFGAAMAALGLVLLIAGSYTPYCLCVLDSSTGIPLLAAIWAVAALGSLAEAFWTFRPRWVSSVIDLAMVWCVVAFMPALHRSMEPAGFWLFVACGLFYTVGAVFYVLKDVRYMHSVFHLFVMVGSLLHFLSVYLYAV